MKKTYKLHIEPITAIHIGTGEELTLIDYLVTSKVGDMDFKRDMYIQYSWDKILESIQSDKVKLSQFMNISNRNNMSDLRNFFHQNITLKAAEAICETTKEFASTYKANMNKDPVQNAAAVFEMQKTPDKDAVIPGSSIKGAIRTALLNMEYSKQKDYIKDKRFNDSLQCELLSGESGRLDAKKDPLRCIAVSDCTSPFKKGTQIVGSVKNIHLSKKTETVEEKASMQILAEFIRGKLSGQETSADGKILIDTDLQKMNSGIKKKYSIEDIIKACNSFYLNEFNKEAKKFYEYESEDTELISPLEEELNNAVNTPNTFILRVGRWRQVEFVTIDDARNPKTPTVKGKKMPWGTSRFVMNYDGQYLPIGWCKCTVSEV